MNMNSTSFINSTNKNSKMGDFQDLYHIDGLSISTTSANLYNYKRDDLVMFYFRNGANYASLYTQSKLISENIKWNLRIKAKKIKVMPKTSDVFFVVSVTFVVLFATNYFLDYMLYR